jgi:hypothetical protein
MVADYWVAGPNRLRERGRTRCAERLVHSRCMRMHDSRTQESMNSAMGWRSLLAPSLDANEAWTTGQFNSASTDLKPTPCRRNRGAERLSSLEKPFT